MIFEDEMKTKDFVKWLIFFYQNVDSWKINDSYIKLACTIQKYIGVAYSALLPPKKKTKNEEDEAKSRRIYDSGIIVTGKFCL